MWVAGERAMGRPILCDHPELAVECLALARRIGLDAEPEACAPYLDRTRVALEAGKLIGLGISEMPSLSQLVELSDAQRRGGGRLLLAGLGDDAKAEQLRRAGGDLGIACFAEVAPLLAAMRLAAAGAKQPWNASTRGLPRVDRTRLGDSVQRAERAEGTLARGEEGLLTWQGRGGSEPIALGAARDVAEALRGLQRADGAPDRVASSVDDVDEQAVLDVLFGPRRALSDPASKAALSPYGIPLPLEELCSSPTRAAAEAGRIGYPVRITLASPDLRVWEHPELEVDMVDAAARVRDTFRQLLSLGRAKLDPERGDPERLLGVMVSASAVTHALMAVRLWPLSRGRVGMSLGFADPHGQAAEDTTLAALPTTVDGIERAISRLRGQGLVLAGSASTQRARLEPIADVLLRLGAFVHEHREQVESVEVRPLALLLDGSVEVRGACVRVSDAFERSLAVPPEAATGA